MGGGGGGGGGLPQESIARDHHLDNKFKPLQT